MSAYRNTGINTEGAAALYDSAAENKQEQGLSHFDRAAAGSRVDWVLIAVVVVLAAFGMVMLYSASAYTAQVEYGDSAYYVKNQLRSLAIGVAAAVICAFIPMTFWRKISGIAFGISLIAVLLTLTPLGVESGGAVRWLNLGFFTMQPSELVKVGLILALAALLCRCYKHLNKIPVYLVLLAVTGIAAGIVAIVNDDLGTAIVILAIGFIMLFITCSRLSYIVCTLAALAAAVAILIAVKPYRLERIYAWLDPAAYASDESYQIVQALYAIGSGGLMGKGLGKSTQKLIVPESQSDMIFSIICEELGILGACFLLILFGVLFWRLWKIYSNTDDMFPKMVTAGILAHIGVQTILNLAVVTGLLPNTGVPLPFISYGGSSIIVLMAEMGIVTSVCRSNYKNAFRKTKKVREDKSKGVIYV